MLRLLIFHPPSVLYCHPSNQEVPSQVPQRTDRHTHENQNQGLSVQGFSCLPLTPSQQAPGDLLF